MAYPFDTYASLPFADVVLCVFSYSEPDLIDGCHVWFFAGSETLQCDAAGRCQCKPGVAGDKCDRCENNYYDFGEAGCRCVGLEFKLTGSLI
jgi:hypothetical protein